MGKTTFISNLISNFKVANSACVRDGSSTTLSQLQADPDSLRTELEPMTVPECSRRVIISIQVRWPFAGRCITAAAGSTTAQQTKRGLLLIKWTVVCTRAKHTTHRG